jgi:hypothetical protein
VWVSSTARPTGRKQGAALHHYGLIHAPCQAVAQTTVGIHQVLTVVLASSRIDNLNAMVTYGDLTEECNEVGQQLVRYIVVDDAQPKSRIDNVKLAQVLVGKWLEAVMRPEIRVGRAE